MALVAFTKNPDVASFIVSVTKASPDAVGQTKNPDKALLVYARSKNSTNITSIGKNILS